MTVKTNKIFPKNGLPSGATAGGIIQIVREQSTTSNQTPGSDGVTSWSDRTPTCNITPQSASNKILIVGSVPCIGANNAYARIRLLRTSTAIRIFEYYNSNTHYMPLHFSGVHIDSPNTTSATTYKYQTACTQNNGDFMWNYNGPDDTEPLRQAEMYLIEVSA